MAGKRNQQAYRGAEQRQGWPAWIWLGLGVLLGGTLAVIVLIKDWAPLLHKKNLPQPNPDATAPREPEQAVADDANKKPSAPKKNFDFYSVLPEMEVVIPPDELSAKARAEQQRAQAAAAQAQAGGTPAVSTTATAAGGADGGGRYLLQAASTTDPKAADELKARLALSGFPVKVVTININGKVWNRVRVGPYASASEAEATRKALSDLNVNAIPLKETGAQ